MKDLRRSAPPARRRLKRYGGCDIEAPVDGVGDCHVKQVDVIDNLCPQRGALMLLLRADEVAVRALFAKADGELPPSPVQKSRVVRARPFTASALHANHGRALTGRNSTLRPGMLAGQEAAKQNKEYRQQDLAIVSSEAHDYRPQPSCH